MAQPRQWRGNPRYFLRLIRQRHQAGETGHNFILPRTKALKTRTEPMVRSRCLSDFNIRGGNDLRELDLEGSLGGW
jgi:hypothetical protein